jgi:Ribbon-helix-helix protein, copG family
MWRGPGQGRAFGDIMPEVAAYGTSAISLDIAEVSVTDILIRDVPDEVIAAVDSHAGRLGLSRSEYVRRRLAQDAAARDTAVSVQDLTRFAEIFSDLADPDVMSQAWR